MTSILRIDITTTMYYEYSKKFRLPKMGCESGLGCESPGCESGL
jgi:hypothetical protein